MRPSRGARDVVVPCEGAGHKVRLAGGFRLLARARCPKCRSAVDPWRIGRALRFVANLRRPASTHVVDIGLWWGAVAAVGLGALIAAAFWGLADRWWVATVLLYGPRWVLLVPIVPLAFVAGIRDRALLVPLAVSAWLILGPVMGFRTGWRSLITFGDPARDMTVVTFNARGGDGLSARPETLMMEWGADVAAFQECGGELRSTIENMIGWHTSTGRALCLVSRFEILDTKIMDREVLESVGGSGLVTSYLLAGDQGPFWLTNLHLDTPRDGLELIRAGRLREGIRTLGVKSLLRDVELRRAQRFTVPSSGPHITVGDFNTPPESRAYREEWGGWTNAFSVAGFGIGGTRLNGWIRARIDHVVVDDSWKVVDARPGEDVGSDHLPMVAIVRRR